MKKKLLWRTQDCVLSDFHKSKWREHFLSCSHKNNRKRQTLLNYFERMNEMSTQKTGMHHWWEACRKAFHNYWGADLAKSDRSKYLLPKRPHEYFVPSPPYRTKQTVSATHLSEIHQKQKSPSEVSFATFTSLRAWMTRLCSPLSDSNSAIFTAIDRCSIRNLLKPSIISSLLILFSAIAF